MNNPNKPTARIVGLVGLAILLAACAGMVRENMPLDPENGFPRYSIRTVYGGLDGTLEQARVVLAKEAQYLCRGDYTRAQEVGNERRTMWGAPNGQFDLTWTVRCVNRR